MKRKEVKCPRCDAWYRARLMRCPACYAANPRAAGKGNKKFDHLVGIVLVVFGAITGIAFTVLLIASMSMGPDGFRGAAAALVLMVLPIALLLHGIVILMGYHPRDFYWWWENVPGPIRRAAWGL